MKATIKTPIEALCAKQPESPMVGAYSLIVDTVDKGMKELIVFRLYQSKGTARVRGCLWVYGAEAVRSGRGHADGFGYHKPSAVLAQCVVNAGFELSEDIDGRGDGVYEPVMRAIASALGHTDRPMLFVRHGGW